MDRAEPAHTYQVWPVSGPAAAKGSARRPRRRLGVRVAFAIIALVLLAIVTEVASVAGWYAVTKGLFTWERAAVARSQAVAGDLIVTGKQDAKQAAAQAAVMRGCVVHPFLGYVYDLSGGATREPVSPYGFVDKEHPLRKRSADRYIVGVVGGSVSLQLCIYAEQTLIAALERSPQLQGRRVEVVRLGLGGYKQPQQVIALQLTTMLGGEFDCLINLDGFNEIGLPNENIGLGVPAWFPRSWARLLDNSPTPEQQRRLGHTAVLREQRAAMAASAEPLWWSPTAQLVWFLRDRRLAQRQSELVIEAERAATKPSFAVTGPGVASPSLAKARREMADIWRRASLQLQALCQSQGIEYFHFLQPNQYFKGSKPIGADEAAVAVDPKHPWSEAVMDGYPLLQEGGEALVQAGVAFEDLTGIFREHREPLYVDVCCHLNQTGYGILAEHIAGSIRRRLELANVVIERLRVSPTQLQFASPLAVERPIVYGIDQAGVEHDITGEGLGTRLVPAAADLVEIGSDGAMRLRRRGATRITVRHGPLSIDLPVSAGWPDVFVGDDATREGTGEMLRLELERDLAAADESVPLRCRNLPKTGLCVLAVSPRPLPATANPNFDLAGVQPIVIDTAAVLPTVSVPMPKTPGMPLFLRAYVMSADGQGVRAASNTVVVTRG